MKGILRLRHGATPRRSGERRATAVSYMSHPGYSHWLFGTTKYFAYLNKVVGDKFVRQHKLGWIDLEPKQDAKFRFSRPFLWDEKVLMKYSKDEPYGGTMRRGGVLPP